MESFCLPLIIWVLCGLAAMYIYQKKGRSGLIGFLGGFFLGPIGLILALVTQEDKNSLKQKEIAEINAQVQNGQLKKCPFCAEYIKPEATVCRFCGRDLVTR